LTFDTGEVLVAEPRMLVGRDPEVADGDPPARLVPIADTDRSVSKTHLVVEAADDGVTVTDRGSTNGTSITRPDGTTGAIEADQPTPAPIGSTVTFGQRTFTVAPTPGTHQR
jgi:predicted component of type VI protein secretion system